MASFRGPLLEKTLLEDPLLLKTPIVRNGKDATVGLRPRDLDGVARVNRRDGVVLKVVCVLKSVEADVLQTNVCCARMKLRAWGAALAAAVFSVIGLSLLRTRRGHRQPAVAAARAISAPASAATPTIRHGRATADRPT